MNDRPGTAANPEARGSARASRALELRSPAGPANPCPGGMLPSMGDYVAINKAIWDERAPVYAASAHYGFDRFIGDAETDRDLRAFDQQGLVLMLTR